MATSGPGRYMPLSGLARLFAGELDPLRSAVSPEPDWKPDIPPEAIERLLEGLREPLFPLPARYQQMRPESQVDAEPFDLDTPLFWRAPRGVPRPLEFFSPEELDHYQQQLRIQRLWSPPEPA